MRKLPQVEAFVVVAGTRQFVVLAPTFNHAVAVTFTELGATTAADLPKPFDMRRAELPKMVVYDGDVEDLRAPQTPIRVKDARRVQAAEKRAADAWETAQASVREAARLQERLVMADRVIDEIRELRGMIAGTLPLVGEPVLEALIAYDGAR